MATSPRTIPIDNPPRATGRPTTHPGTIAGKKLELDGRTVTQLAACGLTLDEIGGILGCHSDTLRRNWYEQVQKGWSQRNASLRRKQFELAMAGSIPMLIFLGKNYLKQSDRITHVGDDGRIAVEVNRESLIRKLLGNREAP